MSTCDTKRMVLDLIQNNDKVNHNWSPVETRWMIKRSKAYINQCFAAFFFLLWTGPVNGPVPNRDRTWSQNRRRTLPNLENGLFPNSLYKNGLVSIRKSQIDYLFCLKTTSEVSKQVWKGNGCCCSCCCSFRMRPTQLPIGGAT